MPAYRTVWDEEPDPHAYDRSGREPRPCESCGEDTWVSVDQPYAIPVICPSCRPCRLDESADEEA